MRRIRAESLFEAISRTAGVPKLEAMRQIAQEVERLDTEGIAGLTVRGLGSEHLYARRLPCSDRWLLLKELTQNLSTSGWREAMTSLGYQIESLPKRGYLASTADQPVIVIHPRQSADPFARLDEDGRLPEGMLVADCLVHGAPYGMLAAGSRMRLLRAGRDASAEGRRGAYRASFSRRPVGWPSRGRETEGGQFSSGATGSILDRP